MSFSSSAAGDVAMAALAQSSPKGRPLRIGLFNVKFSPNLGDGLLSECLEFELRQGFPDIHVCSLDLAGREGFSKGGRFRSTALTLLAHSPTFARQKAVEALLGRALRTRMRPVWRQALRQVDAVVVGGGNLFGDSDLNFPLKIDAAMAEVRAAGLPAAVYGVGLSDNWTPRGEVLFRGALSGVKLAYASVREERSREIWQRRLVPAGVPSARIGYDPGLLVAWHSPLPKRSSTTATPLIGIGLTHPILLRYHADERSVAEAQLGPWFVALASACVRRGWRVALFTNGSPEDDAFLRRIGPGIERAHAAGAVSSQPRFVQPIELASFISGLDGLLAHRLHANIAAYSYRVPHVGFSWDRKLTSFFAQTGRSAYVCSAGVDPPESVADLAARAMVEGIDADRHHKILSDARAHVADLRIALQSAVSSGETAP